MSGGFYKTVAFKCAVTMILVSTLSCFCSGSRRPASLETMMTRILHQPWSGVGTQQNAKHVCCLPAQWESIAYLSSGDVFIDANTFYAFINGTGRIAFDAKNKKSYVHFNMTELTPLMPQPDYASRTVIKDYNMGVMYQISDDGSCEKQNTTKDLSFSCIPETAKKLSEGVLSGGVTMETYRFRYPEFPVLTTASVHIEGSECYPISTTYAVFIENPDSGTLYDLDVLDLTPGIKDSSIFDIPPNCN